MSRTVPVIAVDGPTHAGKTTAITMVMSGPLGALLLPGPEYSDLVPASELPMLPNRSEAQELRALAYFLQLEYRRWAPLIKRVDSSQVILLDRSYHSLLAHVLASDKLFERAVYDRALASVLTERPYTTSLTLCLNSPPNTLRQRARPAPPGSALAHLLSDEYGAAFRSYFAESYCDPKEQLVWIDASTSLTEVVKAVEQAIRTALPRLLA